MTITNKSSLEIVEEFARGMDMERVFDEFEKIDDPNVREAVRSVIVEERRECPECGNAMMNDEDVGELYCPLGCFSFQ